MKRILLLLIWSGVVGRLPAQTPAAAAPQWMRYPAIAPDGKTIAFVYAGDIYTVPATGGEARLWVGGAGYEFMPVWSHDGKRIAYASDRAGNFDVYVRPLAGGQDIQLTRHVADEFPFDFSAKDTRVLFGSARVALAQSRQFPLDEGHKLFEVPSTGGDTRSLLSTPMADVRVGPGGKLVYEDVKTRENRWRKHQTGVGARDIWVYDAAQQVHQRISSFVGEDRNGVYAPDGKIIYYLSERNGSFNIYQQLVGDTTAVAVTAYRGQPVRFLSIDRNGTLCYGYGGQLYIKRYHKATVRVQVNPIPRPDAQRRQLTHQPVTEMAISPSGREIAFVAAGEVFVTSIRDTRVRQITATAAPEAGIGFSPDGKQLIYGTERQGSWEIMQATAVMTPDSLWVSATSIVEQVLISNDADNNQPQFSPDGREIAYIENRQTLKVYHLRTRQSRTILDRQLINEGELDQYFKWSPSGQQLLVQFPAPGNGNSEVGVVDAAGGGALINLSQSGFDDIRPSWQQHGRGITWLSDREGLHGFGRSGKRQLDVYGLFAGQDTALPAAQRTRLTTDAALLSDALLSNDGQRLYCLAKTMDQYDLWCTDLQQQTTRRLSSFGTEGGSLQWDDAQRFLYTLSDGVITQVDPRNGNKRVIPTSVTISIDLEAQRRSMLDHVWRRVATAFYTTGWHGANWPALHDQYAAFLPGIFNNYDLAELLNEMLGELNVSHTGVTYKKEGSRGAGAVAFSATTDSLYQRWVQRNREEVTKASQGRIGYIHLYRMNDAAYRQVVEEVLGSMDRCDALVVDTRYNRGGNLALELEAFLSGTALRDNANDRSVLSREPVARWTKPTIVLANEANYSDGHCFVYDYRLLHLGTLVGMPVPGSCTWQSAHALIDRSLSFAVPVMGVRGINGRYLENQATEPDIEVRNDQDALEAGRDQQLEAAIRTMLQQLQQPVADKP
ncbi:S41 family peptidase [Paraflavitalea pollutisoli]|uniref:S41 family peptidase n=1 Tax=Paraflavitalea pollutisoli TaxID=3034143 RepID=UPI0023EB2EA8|nr:S41 family peptidase [Paraflavitalea sp. H1-2-19X]